MSRSVRLAVSTVMVTVGIWMLTALVGSHRFPSPPVAAPEIADPVLTAASRNPRRIPDPLRRPGEELPTEPGDDRPSVGGGAGLPPQKPDAPLAAAQPLPPVPDAIEEPAPPLENAYHSTLAMTPPPLLDAHELPPLVGGSTWKQAAVPSLVERSPFVAAPRKRDLETVFRAEAPQQAFSGMTYVVQDGDDLTSIASRFYGHPSAAMLVYEANRSSLPSEDLLPIGAILTLPPVFERDGRAPRPGGWIEPGD